MFCQSTRSDYTLLGRFECFQITGFASDPEEDRLESGRDPPGRGAMGQVGW
jgi:hypothetical protein